MVGAKRKGTEKRIKDLLERIAFELPSEPVNAKRHPWISSDSPETVLLVPAADYHLDEIVPLADELNKRGLATRIAVGDSPWQRTRPGMRWYPDLEVFELPEPDTVAKEISLVMTMKDTGSMTDWVTDVRSAGIPVIGKVEGAQDFWDADTPEDRRPYRNLDLVLCQGQFDADALADRETVIVGSSRLERLWRAPPATPPKELLALINLNFVYGVRTADRKLWLETAIEGCRQAGIPYVISVHPAERTKLGPHMTRISASALLSHSSVLISRFSTVPLEAIAMGVPFIYHNPHKENVKTFTDSSDAFVETTSATEILQALKRPLVGGEEQRLRSRSFFLDRVDTKDQFTSEQRVADLVTPFHR